MNPAPKPIRIAFVFNHHFFLGGGEISLALLIEHLDRNIFDPLVFVPGRGEIEDHFIKLHIPVSIVPFAPLREILKGTPLISLLKLSVMLRRKRIHIIHANGSRVCFYSVLAGRLLGLPVIWHVRETIRDQFLYDGFMTLLSRKIICVSKSVLAKRLARFGKAFESKMVVIYNGVDTDLFRPDQEKRNRLRKNLGITDDSLAFGLIGNIIPLKGQDFFLKSYARAKEIHHELRGRVFIAGRSLDPDYFGRLKRLCSELNLAGEVSFMEYGENMADLLSALDVFVLSSKREGFSRSLIEAMSSGLPVLATRLSEIEEAIADSENGLLVYFGDESAMADSVVQLASSDILRKEMGHRNREKASRQFSIMTHAHSVETAYLSLWKSKWVCHHRSD